jgi:hypothetical protein
MNLRRTWGRIGLSVAALVFALSISSSFAGSVSDAIGAATLSPTNGSSARGQAFIRQLASGTHVSVRVTGLTWGSQPVVRVSSGGTVVFTSASVTATRAGTALFMLPNSPAIAIGPITAPNWVSVCVLESALGKELACGHVMDMPGPGTAHWW